MTDDTSRADGRVATIVRSPAAGAAQAWPASGRIPVLEIVTDPAVVRIAVFAVGIAALLLAIAALL